MYPSYEHRVTNNIVSDAARLILLLGTQDIESRSCAGKGTIYENNKKINKTTGIPNNYSTRIIIFNSLIAIK